MKKFVKIISLMLVVLMLAAAFAACDKKKNENKDDPKDTVANTQNSGTASDGANATTKVPDIAVQYWDNKEYRILGRMDSDVDVYAWAQNFEVYREEMPEDVVGKAVWKRNNDILQTYGIDVQGYLSKDFTSIAQTTLDAGEDLYDLMILAPEKFHPHAIKGYLLDLYKLDYINMEHDAWLDIPNSQLSMGGKLYYTTNKFLIQDKSRCWLTFYNRDMAKELNLGYFEEFVFDGTWTIDKVVELGKQATYEKDGQPGMTKFDNWGVVVAEYYSFSQIAYGTGFSFTEKGADDYPKFVGTTDLMMRRLDKAYSLTGNNEVYFCDQMVYGGKVDYKDCAYHIFYGGRALLHPGVLSQLDDMQTQCSFEYAPLPNPKYDENQEMYYAIPNLGNGSLLGVPSTVAEPEFAGYALEVISEQSAYTTYDAFIENKCLLQNVVDQDAANCLRLVFEGVTYDIAFITNIGGFGKLMMSDLGKYTNNTFERLHNRLIGTAEVELERIKAAYAELEQ